MRIISALFIVVMLASCSSPNSQYGYEAKRLSQKRYLYELEHQDYITHDISWEEKLDDKKQHFNDLLKREYIAFANDLEKDNNHSEASYFRRKGLDAERSDFDILPEKPGKWNVKDANEFEELSSARLDLIDALVGFTPVIKPVNSAKALVSYDCWLQQSQKKSSAHNKTDCKKNFQTNYTEIATIPTDLRGKTFTAANKKYNGIAIEESSGNRFTRFLKLDTDDKENDKKEALEKEFEYSRSTSDENPPGNRFTRFFGLTPRVKATADLPETAEAQLVDGAENKTGKKTAGKKTVVTKTATKTSGDATSAKVTTTSKVTATAATGKTAPVAKTAAAPVVRKSPVEPQERALIIDQSDKSAELVFVAYFDTKSEILNPVAIAELDKTIEQIKKSAPKIVSVKGHTDRSFDSSTSLITSKKRADAVRDYLISKGISKEIIRTYGFGKTDNLVDNAEGEEKPANNRVEISFKAAAQ